MGWGVVGKGEGYGRRLLFCNRKGAEDQEGSQEKQGRSVGNAMYGRWKVWTPCYPHPTCWISFAEIARAKAN